MIKKIFRSFFIAVGGFCYCQKWGTPSNTLKLPAIDILKEGHLIINWIKDDGITLGGNTMITDANTGFQKTSTVVLEDNRLSTE